MTIPFEAFVNAELPYRISTTTLTPTPGHVPVASGVGAGVTWVAPATLAPVTSVNGMTGAVTVATGVPAWATGGVYSTDQPVRYQGATWVCTTPHTAGASFDTTKFTPISNPLLTTTTSTFTAANIDMTGSTDSQITGQGGRIRYSTRCYVHSSQVTLTDARINGSGGVSHTSCMVLGKGLVDVYDLTGLGSLVAATDAIVMGGGTIKGNANNSAVILAGTIQPFTTNGLVMNSPSSTLSGGTRSVIIGGTGHTSPAADNAVILGGSSNTLTSGTAAAIVGSASCTLSYTGVGGGLYSCNAVTGSRAIFCNTVSGAAATSFAANLSNVSVALASGASGGFSGISVYSSTITNYGAKSTIGTYTSPISLFLGGTGYSDGRCPSQGVVHGGASINGYAHAGLSQTIKSRRHQATVAAYTTSAGTFALYENANNGGPYWYPPKVLTRESGKFAIGTHIIEVFGYSGTSRMFSARLRVVYAFDGTTYTKVSETVLASGGINNAGGELSVTCDSTADDHLRVNVTSTVAENIHWSATIDSTFNTA